MGVWENIKATAKETGRFFVEDVLGGTAALGVETARAAARAVAIPTVGLVQSVQGKNEAVDVPFVGRIEKFGTKEGAAQSAGAALETATTFLPLGIIGRSAKPGISTLRRVATAGTIDFTAGAAAGAGTRLATDPDATAREVAETALLTGSASLLAPHALGVTLKGGIKAGSFAGKQVKRAGTTITETLERVAQPPAKTGVFVTKADEFVDIAKGAAKKPTLQQKAAETALKGIKWAGTFQQHWTDALAPISKLERQAEGKLGRKLEPDEKAYMQARLYAGIGGRVENRLDDFESILTDNFQIRDELRAYLLAKDFIERGKQGQSLPRGKTVTEAEQAIVDLEQKLGSEGYQQLEDVAADVYDFQDNVLRDRVDSGLLSEAQYNAIKAKHQNYIPHDVTDFTDDEAAQSFTGKKMFNVAQTDVKKAVGSQREIDDPFAAIVNRTASGVTLAERNRVTKNIVRLAEKSGIEVTPLRTAENVEARKTIFNRLRQTREQLDGLVDLQRSGKTTKKGLDERITQLQKRYDEEERKLFDELLVLQGESGEAAELLAKARADLELVESTDLSFFDTELDSAYGRFKSIWSRRSNLRDKAVDIESLRGQLSPEEWENLDITMGFEQYGRRLSDDETFEMFVDRFNKEKTLPKPLRGIIRKGKSIEKRVTAQESRMTGVEEKMISETEAAQDIDRLLAFSERSIEDISATRKQMVKELTGLRDVEKKRVDFQRAGMEKVSFFERGIKEEYLVPKDIGDAMKGLNEAESGLFINLLALPTKALRAGATRFNPSFILTNLERDIQTLATTTEQGLSPLGWVENLINQQGDDTVYRQWRELGGKGSTLAREGRTPRDIVRQIESNSIEMTTGQGKLRRGINKTAFWKGIEAANEKVEQASRLTAFKQALAAGKDPLEAAYLARNATVDFARMGSTMRTVNKIVPFLNARVQGTINIGKAIKRDPTAFMRQQMYYAVAPTLLLYNHNSQFDSYKIIPQTTKDQYHIIMIGETDGVDREGNWVHVPQFIKIRKGEAIMPISNAIMAYFDFATDKGGPSAIDWLSSTAEGMSPITMSEGGLAEKLASNLGPLAGIVYGQATGKHPFFGYNIIPQNRKKAEAALQYDPTYTSEISIKVGKMLNMSPAMIEFYVTQIGGGLATDALKITQVIGGELPSKTESLFGKAAAFPVTRSVFGESISESGTPARQRQRRTKEKIETEVTSEKLRIKDQAASIFNDVKKYRTTGERAAVLNEYETSGGLTPEIKKELKSLLNKKQAVEVLSTGDSVEVRARYIVTRLVEMKTQDERVRFLSDLETEKILTDSVRERIAQIKENFRD